MKIALIGYGKMGRRIEEISQSQGDQIVALFSEKRGMPQDRMQDLAQAEIAIDFSHSSAVLMNLDCCLALKKPLVIGTTGWEEFLQEAKQRTIQMGGSCLYAPNFSLGVYLFQKILSYAAALFQPLDEYDTCGVEYHNKQKADRPSGTAKMLSQIISDQMPRRNPFEFSSVRCGHMEGTHTVYFDGLSDTLTLNHQAKNRIGFAKGALSAAKWLLQPNRRGFFTLEDMMARNYFTCP